MLNSCTRDKRADHRPLVVILIIFVFLSLAYSLVLPLGEAADEVDHFALVRFVARQGRPPLTQEERRSISTKGDASPIYHGLVALLTQHVDVSAVPELPQTQQRPERFIPSDGFRTVLFHTEDESFPFHDIALAWHLARLISIPLGAATVIATYITAQTIYPDRRHFALAAASFVAFLPRFVIGSAIVSDDSMVVPLVAFCVYYLIRVTQGDTRRRTFVALGALMGLAAIVKYHALVLLPEMTVVLIAIAWRNRWGLQILLRRWGLSMLVFTLSAGWWFGFVLMQFNQVAELGWVRGIIAPLGDPVVTLGFGRLLDFRPGSMPNSELSWLEWAPRLFRTFWIVYGWYHVFAPAIVYRVLGLFTTVALLGLVRQGWTQIKAHTHFSQAWRPDVALLAFHFFVYLSLVVMRHAMRPALETAQGRHLYPAITSIAFFYVLGLHGALNWLSDNLHRAWSRPARDKALAMGVSSVLIMLSVLTPSLFILPVYLPYLPIVTADPADAPIPYRLKVSFAKGVNLEGYDLGESEIKAGEALPVTLYWYAETRQERDYLVRLCLYNDSGQAVACRQGHPVGGRYPMRAWEPGYLIRDETYLPIPHYLSPGEYQLTLSILPLRLDTVSTAIDKNAEAREPVSLSRVTLLPAEQPQPGSLYLWVGNECHTQGEITLRQLRQTLTVISYRLGTHSTDNHPDNLRLVPADTDPASDTSWTPVEGSVTYRCPDGSAVSVVNFIVGPGIRPGRYHLEVSNQVQSDLLVTVATRLRDFSTPANIPTYVRASFAGEAELLGYDADLSPRWPGDTVHVTAYWRALRTMSRHYVVTLRLVDNTMNTWAQNDETLGGNYPNVLWGPGETTNEVYALPLSYQTPPGLYTIEFSVYYAPLAGVLYYLPATTADNPDPVEHLYLGRVRVMDPARARPPAHPMTVELGSQIQLLGYDLSSEQLVVNEPLHLTLYWQAINQPRTDYTVFTQLIGPDGLVWGQQDNQPQGGRYPTTAWAVQDRVVDRYELTLREGAPPGQYRLLVGMYDLATGQRLTAIGEGGTRLPDDAILLTTLTVE